MRRGQCTGIVLIVMWTLCMVGIAFTQVPKKISYQGVLIDAETGDPLVGTYNVTFKIYDQLTGGTLLWSESQDIATDSSGVFSVTLGSVTPLNLEFDQPTWLEVVVGTEVLTPRREIVSVPYAFHSMNADSLGGTPADSFALANHNHDDRYFTETELSEPGTINEASNPVDWTKLKNVPSGFADGVDDVGGAGDGHSLDAADGSPVDVVYVDNDGNVGIGTTSPDAKLEVNGDVMLPLDGSLNFGSGSTRIYRSGSDMYCAATDDIHLRPGDDLYIGKDGASNWIRVDNDGEVLSVGTTNPPNTVSKIYVSPDGKWAGITVEDTTGLSSYPIYARWKGSSGGAAIIAENEGTGGDAIQADAAGTGRSAIYAVGSDGVDYTIYAEANGATHAGYFKGAEGGSHITMLIYNTDPTGTALSVGGQGELGWYFGAGSGATISGYGIGLGVRAERSDNGDQAAIVTQLGSGETVRVNYRTTGGTHYKIYGDGIVSSVMETRQGRRALVSPESPEAWIDDYGSGEIVNGRCHVELDPLYLDCVTINEAHPMKVFVQLTSPMTNQFYVEKGTTGFDVIVTGEGAESVHATFDWRVVAKWKGYEELRFENYEEPPQMLQVQPVEGE